MGFFDFVLKPIQNLIGEVLGFLVGQDFDDANQASGVLVNKQSNIDSIPVVYGRRKVGGVRAFISTGGGKSNEFLYVALVLSEGEIDAIEEIYINDVLHTDAKYNGLITVDTTKLGSDSQTYSTLLAGADASWGGNHRLRGVAYLAIRIKYDQDVFGGIPDIQCVIRGRKVFDPRTSTTAYSNNPALCLRDYLTNPRYGKGLSASLINDPSFIAAANTLDTLVTSYSGGGTQKLLECNAVIDTGKTLFDNVKIMLQGMRGLMPYSNGIYSLLIDKNESSTFTLTPDNITSKLSVASSGKDKKYNKVTVKYINPEANWQSDAAIYPEAGSAEEVNFLLEDNDEELAREVTMNTITNPYSAKDLARIICLASRQNTLTTKVTATSEAMAIAVGDVVTLQHPSMGWTGASQKQFRVIAMQLRDSGEVDLTLQEYSASIYPWVVGSEVAIPPETTLPDPFTVAAPTSLGTVAGSEVLSDGSINSFVSIAWTASNDAFVRRYDVRVFATANPDQDSFYLSVDGTEARVNGLVPSISYTVTVRAINSNNSRSGTLTDTFVAVGDTLAPAAPSDIAVQGNFKAIDIFWTNASDADLSYVEVKESTTATEGDAVIVGRSAGSSFSKAFGNGIFTRYYWLRSVDTSGNESAWVSAGSGTTLLLGAGDFDDGIIDIDYLNAGLQTSINSAVDVTTFNNTISSVQTDIQDFEATIAGFEATIQDLTSGVSDVYVTPEPPVAGVGGIPDPIPTFSRWYDSDDSNEPYYWDDTQWVSLADPRIASNTASIATLQSGLNTANSDISANSDLITALDTLTITQGDSITSLSSDVTTLQSDLTAAEGDITANASAISGLDTRVTAAEGTITTQSSDITALETSVSDLQTDTTANTSAISGLDTRVAQTESDITANSTSITALETTVNDESTGVAATASGLSALDTRVTTAEGNITTNASDITALELTVNDPNDGVIANSSAVSSLDTRVTATEGSILSQSSDITNLQSKVSGGSRTLAFKRNAISFTNLQGGEIFVHGYDSSGNPANVNGSIIIDGVLTEIPRDYTNPNNAFGKSYVIYDSARTFDVNRYYFHARKEGNTWKGVSTSIAPTAFTPTANMWIIGAANVSQAEFIESAVAYTEAIPLDVASDTVIIPEDIGAATATAVTQLETRVTNTENDIVSISSDFTLLRSDVDDNSAAITSESATRASEDLALASDISIVQANINTLQDYVESASYVFDAADSSIFSQGSNITSIVDRGDYVEITEGTGARDTSGATNGAYLTIPADFAIPLAGRRVRITLQARSGTQSGFAVAYSTSHVGNSGVLSGTASADWRLFDFFYDVPATSNSGTDYIGIFANNNNGSIEIRKIIISAETQGVLDVEASVASETSARVSADDALALSIQNLQSEVDGNTASITSEASTRASEDNSLSARIDSLTSTVNGNTADISSEASTRASEDSALAADITNLEARVDGRALGLPVEQWKNLNGQSIVSISDGIAGPTALRLTGAGAYPNQGTYIQIDPEKTYRVKFWAKPSTDNTTGRLYFSLRQFLPDGSAGPVNSGRSPYKPSAITASNHRSSYGDNWHDYIYNWTASDWQTGVTQVLPEFLDNYNNEAGHWDIQGFEIIDATNIAAVEQTTVALVSADAAITQNIATLQSEVDGNTAAISTEAATRASQDSALALSIQNLQSEVDGNTAAITSEASTRASADSALSASITSLTTTVNGNTTTIQQQATTIDGVRAQYSVAIDNNGHISGYALISADIGQGETPTAQFIVNADAFAIGGTGSASDSYPFVVYPSGATVDGVTIPAGTYIDSARINYLSASNIEAGVLNLGNQSGMAIRQGKTSYTISGTGFWLGNDGGTPRFILGSSTQYISFDGGTGAINASGITARSITVRNNFNQVMLDANGIDGTYIADASIDSASIKDLAVGTIKIADQAVTLPESTYTEAAQIKNSGVTAEQVLQTVTVDSTGAPTEIFGSFTIDSTYNLTTSHTIRIKRGTTTLSQANIVVGSTDEFPFAAAVTDSLTTSGSRTYTITAQGFGSWSIKNRYLRTLELKK